MSLVAEQYDEQAALLGLMPVHAPAACLPEIRLASRPKPLVQDGVSLIAEQYDEQAALLGLMHRPAARLGLPAIRPASERVSRRDNYLERATGCIPLLFQCSQQYLPSPLVLDRATCHHALYAWTPRCVVFKLRKTPWRDQVPHFSTLSVDSSLQGLPVTRFKLQLPLPTLLRARKHLL